MPVMLRDDGIHVKFAYNERLNNIVAGITGRTWDKKERVWKLPATPWHARELIEKLGDEVDVFQDVKWLAEKDVQLDRLSSSLDFTVTVDGKILRPRPYQAAVIPFLETVNGRGMICDHMGLGKTLEALLWVRHKQIKRFLVVCPASVLYKWQKEIITWLPGYTATVLETGKTPIDDSNGIICSYNIMTRRYKELEKLNVPYIIFDECHRIKDYKSQRCKAAQYIAAGIPWIVGLSGTPLLNKPMELFNMLHLLDPIAWKLWDYRKYVYNDETGGWDGAYHLDELKKRVDGIMILRTKQDVKSQLPPFTRTIIPVEIDRAEYRAAYSAFRDIASVIHMQQVLEIEKAKIVIEMIDDILDIPGKKVILYCHYKDTIKFLADKLKLWGVLQITGDTPNKDRPDIIHRWQNATRDRVMLLTSAGGEGIDLFGKNGIDSSLIIFVGREWGPAIEEQVEGRIDRLGQEFPPEALYLVAKRTIDEETHALIEAKRTVIKQSIRTADTEASFQADLLAAIQKRKG